jgi:tetratricopeptide (TPR) repeat protein
LVVGCRGGQLADPNDPKDGPVAAESISRQIEALNNGLFQRWQKKEFSEKRYLELLKKGADEILDKGNIDAMDPSEIWMYAAALRTAERWEEAEKALRIAIRHAKAVKNEDRRINDTLRLAQVEAKLGKTDEAIALAEETLNAKPADAVPVLMGILYEVVPAASGKGKDLALAELLKRAIKVHASAVVDPQTDAGKAFLLARPTHIRKATNEMVDLYIAAGRRDLAEQAVGN